MENKINLVQAGIWGGFFLLLAVTLLVNLCQALSGYADLAVWHWPTLAIAWWFFRAHLTTVQYCRLLIHIKQSPAILLAVAKLAWHVCRKVSKSAVAAARALGTLPDLFIQSYNHFQTEP